MVFDERLDKIFEDYSKKWNREILVNIRSTLKFQIKLYLKKFKIKIKEIDLINIDEELIYNEYKILGFFILWFSLIRTLDIRVSYMLLRRSSIIFTEYLETFKRSKKNKKQVSFSIQDLTSYILKTLLGNIVIPIRYDILQEHKHQLWSTLVELYSKSTLEE